MRKFHMASVSYGYSYILRTCTKEIQMVMRREDYLDYHRTRVIQCAIGGAPLFLNPNFVFYYIDFSALS